jgi:hypothetical protein
MVTIAVVADNVPVLVGVWMTVDGGLMVLRPPVAVTVTVGDILDVGLTGNGSGSGTEQL